MVNPSQFLDPDVFFVVSRGAPAITSYLHSTLRLLLHHRDGFLVCVNKRF